jgi:uncharacterized protein YkwD
MKSLSKWTLVLAVGLAVMLPMVPAWGQLRIRSGAFPKKHNKIYHPKELERRIFILTNEARRRHALPPLTDDSALQATAREHCDDMIKRHYFSHTSPEGQTLGDRLKHEEPAVVRTMVRAGENIYMSSKLDSSDTPTIARLIVDGWMTSPGHRANILNDKFTHLGVAVAVAGQEIMAAQNFAEEKSQGREKIIPLPPSSHLNDR